jgi:hypothetical protein
MAVRFRLEMTVRRRSRRLYPGIIWATGILGRGNRETYTYLPNRSCVLPPTATTEPETLAALLRTDPPVVDTLLRKPVTGYRIFAKV